MEQSDQGLHCLLSTSAHYFEKLQKIDQPESSESSELLVFSSSVQLGLGSEGPGSVSGDSPGGGGVSPIPSVFPTTGRLSLPIGFCRTSGGIKLLIFSKFDTSEIESARHYIIKVFE